MATISPELRAGVMSMPHVRYETFMSNGHEVLEDDQPAEDEFDLPIEEDLSSYSRNSEDAREDNATDFMGIASSTNQRNSHSNRIFKTDHYANLRVQFPNDEQLSPQQINKALREQKQALGLQLQELERIETQNAKVR